ncbi:MAG: hypothetical protein IAE91_05850 [Ignavibacteriaceae bacterium]|nr:hypothetical protein [Ignavibacteriaceae bacterium]
MDQLGGSVAPFFYFVLIGGLFALVISVIIISLSKYRENRNLAETQVLEKSSGVIIEYGDDLINVSEKEKMKVVSNRQKVTDDRSLKFN